MRGPKPKRFCKYGHDTSVTGRYDGQCKICKNEQSIRRRQINNTSTQILPKVKGHRTPKQFCVKNHDTFLCRRTKEGHCKDCRKQYRIDNREHINKQKKEYRELNTEKISVQKKIYHGKPEVKENRKSKGKIYRQNNKERYRTYQRNYKIEKLASDISYKIKERLRNRLRDAIKNNRKVGSAVQDLGCTIEFLKEYIESQFHDGMTWQNWGPVWELDHIKELHDFDLIDRKQFLEVCHYTNLQPLTIEEHKKKTIEGLKTRRKPQRRNK
jgi:hypothetical protein